MAIKREKLSQFGQRLYDLMGERGCQTPKALAKMLIDAKLVSVKTRGEDIFKNKDNAVGSVEKKIRTHLCAEGPTCLQGEFVNAYCKFFACSADYLFLYTDIRTPNVTIKDMCERMGLSEEAVSRLVEDATDNNSRKRCVLWSKILSSDLYYLVIRDWLMAFDRMYYAIRKEVERDKITEALEHEGGRVALELQCDLEGANNELTSANAAYAGILFNISRSVASFVEYDLTHNLGVSIEEIKKRYAEAFDPMRDYRQ